MHIKNIKNFLKNYGRIISIILITIVFFLLVSFYLSSSKNQKLVVRFLDIGQGDAILIQTREKNSILIDAGPGDTIVRKMEEYFSVFNRKIEYVVLTHPDADHVGGFSYLLSKYNIPNVLLNGDEHNPTELYQGILEKLVGKKKETANCGDKISFDIDGDLVFYVLSPEQGSLFINETNDNSIVLLATYGKYSFLFTGDAVKK